MTENKKGLWANIHAKRARGERPARPGEKGYPKTLDIDEANDAEKYTYIDQTKGPVLKGKTGSYVGYTHSATKGKGANILKHNKTKKYYAAGGSSTAFTQKTTLHDTPEDAARAYHKGNLAEASPMIKPPKNEFGKKEDAFAHAKQHGGKVMKKTFTHPTSGMQTVSYVVREETVLDEANFADIMKKAIAAHERGDHKRAKYHLDNAKTARYAMPSTEISKNKDMLDKYKELSKMHEEAEIDEASKKPNATTRHLRDYPVSDKDVAKPITYYSLVHKATNKVLSTHKDLESAKDEHRGMDQGERAYYRIATSTKAPKSFDMTEEAKGVAEETKKMKGKDPCWTGYKMIGTKEKGGRQVPNCVPVKEQMTFRKLREQDNKEVQEYDYEGDMARSDLRSIIMNAKEVHDMLASNTNLPEWVQSKITLSEDYISTVRNYMRSENDNV